MRFKPQKNAVKLNILKNHTLKIKNDYRQTNILNLILHFNLIDGQE